MRENLARYASSCPRLLEQRLCELDSEWDVDRVTTTAYSLLLLLGLFPAALAGGWWWAAPVLFAAFLVLHTAAGWSPGLPLVRQFGFRNSREINQERYALKAIRGDFQRLALVPSPQDREDIARLEDEGGPPAPEPEPEPEPHHEIVTEALDAARK
jgi:hypothetical protein